MSLFPIISPVPLVGYRYLKINGTATTDGPGGSYREIKWFVDTTDYPAAAMTANDAPSPLVVSANEEDSGAAYLAYDNSSAHWDTTTSLPSYIKLDLGAGNEIEPTSVKLTAGAAYNRVFLNFTLEGSNDDSAWDVLKTVTGESGWSNGLERTYTI